MDRVQSGVKGFDELINGGIPKHHSILLCGAPGTGKTIFSLQFLYNGAKKFDERGIYLSIEEDPKKLMSYANEFGWDDLPDLVHDEKINFIRVRADERKFDVVKIVKDAVVKYNAKRLVVDSLSAIYLAFEDINQFIYSFVNLLEELELTSVFITDSSSDGKLLTKDGVSEFVCDGVVQLQLNDTGHNINRTISVKKMRGTAMIPGAKSLKFTPTGLEVGEFKVFY